MTQPADVAARHAGLVAALAPGLAAAEALRGICARDGDLLEDHAALGVWSIKGRLLGSAVVALGPVLVDAAVAGHRVTASTVTEGPGLTVTWTRTGRADVEMRGSADELVGTRRGADLQRAADRADADAAMALLGDTPFEVALVIIPPKGGAAWAPIGAQLLDRLHDGRWASTLLQITGGHSPAVVVVQDAGADVLRCPGVVFAGPQTSFEALKPRSAHQADLSDSYRRSPSRVTFRPLPVPVDLVAEPSDAGVLEPLRPALAAVARACCWYWLGRRSEVAPDHATTAFEGARPLVLDLLPVPGAGAEAEAALFTWAAAVSDPVRDDAVHQAVSFAVRATSDLPGAAGHVLRTARSLYELAGRGAVAEALAARRAARDAAVTAARAAAAAAREVATKAVERSVTLLVAAAVALFANGRNLLGTQAAAIVVAAAAALAAVALLIALLVELPSGEGLLDAFDQDAGLYREALGEDDLKAVRNLAATRAARRDLRRARAAAKAVYLAVAGAIAIAGLVALSPSDASSPPDKPSPTQPAGNPPTPTVARTAASSPRAGRPVSTPPATTSPVDVGGTPTGTTTP